MKKKHYYLWEMNICKIKAFGQLSITYFLYVIDIIFYEIDYVYDSRSTLTLLTSESDVQRRSKDGPRTERIKKI